MKTPHGAILALVPSLCFALYGCSGESSSDDDVSSTASSPTPVPVLESPTPAVSPTPMVECPECSEVGPHHVVLKLKWPGVAGTVKCHPSDDASEVSSPSVIVAEGDQSKEEFYFLLAETSYTCTAQAGDYSHEITFKTAPTHPALQDGLQLAGSSMKSAPGYAVGHLSVYNPDGASFNGCVVVDPLGQYRGFVEVMGGYVNCELLVKGEEGRPEILFSGSTTEACVPPDTYPEYDPDGERSAVPQYVYAEFRSDRHSSVTAMNAKTSTTGGGSGGYGYYSYSGSSCGSYGWSGGVSRVNLRGDVLMQAAEVETLDPDNEDLQELGVGYDSHDATRGANGKVYGLTWESCNVDEESWSSFGWARINAETGAVEKYWSACIDGVDQHIDSPLNDDSSPTPEVDTTPEPQGAVNGGSGDDDDSTGGSYSSPTPGSCSFWICDSYGTCWCASSSYGGGSDFYHANTIWRDGTSIWVNAKHRNELIEIDEESGQILDYIGVDKGYTLLNKDGTFASDSRWWFREHDARVTGDIVTVHNNATDRQDWDPSDPQHTSAGVYQLDRKNLTATILLDWVPSPGGVPDYHWNEDIFGAVDRFVRSDTQGHAIIVGMNNGFPFGDSVEGPVYRSAWPIIDEETGLLVRAWVLPDGGSTYRVRFIQGCDIPNTKWCAQPTN